jgi:Zn2+/Cd2+-exporting ATPase
MAQHIYRVGNMDCAHCAQEVQEGVSSLDGVQSVNVDFVTTKMVIEGDVDFAMLQARVESLGKTVTPENVPVAPQAPKRGGVLGFWDYLLSRHETRLALIGASIIVLGVMLSLLLTGEIYGIGHGISETPQPLIALIYSTAMVVALYPIAKQGMNAWRINRTFSINLLMTIAAIGAILIGEYLEGALVIFLFAVGEALEGYTADRARDSLRALLALKPQEALLLQGQMTLVTPVEQLRVGDLILVRAGERIPMDGVVMSGDSGVDQSPITGESMPVAKTINDDVFAGTLNGYGTLTIKVTRLVADNTLSRIIQLVEEAQSKRAPSQRLIDQFAHYYTPSVAIVAFFVAILPPLLFNAPLLNTDTQQGWLYRAITMLVIACPCALVISTPVTIISAITAAARRGVLIKGGAYLESLGSIRAIAFDKTGTLTQGKPVVMGVVAHQNDSQKLLGLLASLEAQSTHPLAHAILQYAQAHAIQSAPAQNVQTIAGQGLQGTIDGRMITLGSLRYFEEKFPYDTLFYMPAKQAESEGNTVVLLHDGNGVSGFVAISDPLRPESASVVRELKTLGLTSIMCTGDNALVAKTIAQHAGVYAVRAELLPQDKLDIVHELRQQYHSVAMVGDGINDTPALASATVGIAMGKAGSAQALETADIVLLGDDLRQLPFSIRLSRFAVGIIRWNIALSLGLKLAFLALAFFGGASLWLAVFADVGMSLIVTLNGMRPLRLR